MPDIFTKAKRSAVMARIRSRGNRDTEMVLARLLREHGITGWRRHLAVFGRPDFAFPRLRVALFVDGCFWHGCAKHCRVPAGNRAFWKKKFARNQMRDSLVTRTLRSRGWRVVRVWEHDLARRNRARLVRRIRRALALEK